MTDKEAMAMALDALETEVSIDWTNNDEFNASAEKMHEAIAALKSRLAQPEPIQSLECFHCQVTIETLNDKVRHLLAQRTEQEPVAWLDPWTRNNVTTDYDAYGNNGIPLYTAPPQRIEQNFCSRCGKRTKDIHTCTPPREGT